MPHLRSRSLATLALLTGLASAGTARADAIDGNWCAKDGRALTIDGPRIITPGGTRMTGDYDRHGFVYVIPDGEPGAGGRVVMRLLSELAVRVVTGETTETWNRCSPAA